MKKLESLQASQKIMKYIKEAEKFKVGDRIKIRPNYKELILLGVDARYLPLYSMSRNIDVEDNPMNIRYTKDLIIDYYVRRDKKSIVKIHEMERKKGVLIGLELGGRRLDLYLYEKHEPTLYNIINEE